MGNSDNISTTFNFNQGPNYTLDIISGIVLETSTRSDTHVSGSGSSVSYQGSGGGSVSISSTIIVTKEIWIRTLSGKEVCINLYGEGFKVRAGHIIHVGYLNDKMIRLWNQSTDLVWEYKNNIISNIEEKPGTFWFFLLITDIPFLAASAYFDLITQSPAFVLFLFFLLIPSINYYFYASKEKKRKEMLIENVKKEFNKSIPQMESVSSQLINPRSAHNTIDQPAAPAALPMTFCPDCGYHIEIEDVFCSGCGYKISPAY